MRIVVPRWHNRVSPVLDAACTFAVYDTDTGNCDEPEVVTVRDCDALARIQLLSRLNIDVVICGAVSKPVELALLSSGMKVIANRCGEVDEIYHAFLHDGLDRQIFFMPGNYTAYDNREEKKE